jgi:hypothetical protein
MQFERRVSGSLFGNSVHRGQADSPSNGVRQLPIRRSSGGRDGCYGLPQARAVLVAIIWQIMGSELVGAVPPESGTPPGRLACRLGGLRRLYADAP